jgi:amino acid transporter
MGALELDGHITVQPKKYSKFEVTTPQPEYMNWSTASLLVCFVWGIFAFIASNKVRKYNSMGAYDQAAHYSQKAKELNQSAVACCVIMFCILGIPLAISLAVQGDINKFPSALQFFGK